MEKVKIKNVEYPAEISGTLHDSAWDGRESKTITLAMEPATAASLFVDGASWSIISEWEDDGQAMREEYDNSDFSVAGDVIDHRDGTVSVKMGMPTDLELAYELLYGGEN